jgi:hypothetical protein
MLIIATLLIMALVGYFFSQEGLFTAFLMLVNVLIAGLLTFNFWEPLAGALAPLFARNFLRGCEDFLAITLIFGSALALLRIVTEKLNYTQIAFPAVAQRLGGLFFGLLTGYLVTGLLVVALQTLPWGQHFLGFQPPTADASAVRSYLPPDRVWLALMHRAGTQSFNRRELTHEERDERESEDDADYYYTFDRHGSFEVRYFRLRRTRDR